MPKTTQSLVKSESDGDVNLQLRVYYIDYEGQAMRKYGGFFIDPLKATMLSKENEEKSSAQPTAFNANTNQVEADDPELTPEEKK